MPSLKKRNRKSWKSDVYLSFGVIGIRILSYTLMYIAKFKIFINIIIESKTDFLLEIFK